MLAAVLIIIRSIFEGRTATASSWMDIKSVGGWYNSNFRFFYSCLFPSCLITLSCCCLTIAPIEVLVDILSPEINSSVFPRSKFLNVLMGSEILFLLVCYFLTFKWRMSIFTLNTSSAGKFSTLCKNFTLVSLVSGNKFSDS